MSLILDALNRSRQEQAQELPPSLDTVHYADLPATPRSVRWLVASLTAALLITFGALLWFLPERYVSRSPEMVVNDEPKVVVSEPEVVVSERKAQPVKAAQGEISTPSAPADSRGLPARETVGDAPSSPEAGVTSNASKIEPEVAALYDGLSAPERSIVPIDKAGEGAETRARPGTDTDQTKAGAGQPAPAFEEEPIDVEAVLSRAQQQLGRPVLSPHPAPLLETLSQQTKDRIPTVIYSRHDYAPEGRSSVTLNNTRLEAGERDRGFLIEAILQDSVVLSWGGTEFRLRALNSWINL